MLLGEPDAAAIDVIVSYEQRTRPGAALARMASGVFAYSLALDREKDAA